MVRKGSVATTFRAALADRRFLCVAHRGARAYAPENTLPAFELALAQGADVLELDVHLSRDDEVVVIHDARVDRTTNGRGAVRDLRWADLQALDAGMWWGPAWRGTRIPALREVLERFAGRALVDIELKAGVPSGPADSEGDFAHAERLAARTLEVVEAAGAADRVVLSSFGAAVLRWVRVRAPSVPLQWSVASRDIAGDCAAAAGDGFEIISPQVDAASPEAVAQAHAHGLAVHIYAGEDEAVLAALLDLGVDALKTGRPDVLRRLVSARAR